MTESHEKPESADRSTSAHFGMHSDQKTLTVSSSRIPMQQLEGCKQTFNAIADALYVLGLATAEMAVKESDESHFTLSVKIVRPTFLEKALERATETPSE